MISHSLMEGRLNIGGVDKFEYNQDACKNKEDKFTSELAVKKHQTLSKNIKHLLQAGEKNLILTGL